MIGMKVGFLEVVAETDKRIRRNKVWVCKCVCGNEIDVSAAVLKAGDKKSCGCKTKAETVGSHGMHGTPTHNSWRTMRERCTKEYHKSYEKYKDIPVDPEWLDSFEAFYKDMGERPEGMTLDRIDNSLGYCKENCRWADASTQQQNKSPNYINKNKGLAGVFESNGKFCARIRYDGKREYLGTFDTPELANEAYNRRGYEIFGDAWVYKGQKKY